MTSSSLASKFGAELFGTYWLVFGGCGSAIFAAKQIAQAEDGSGVLPIGHRLPRGGIGVRANRRHDGLRGRSRLGRTFQPRDQSGRRGEWPAAWKDLPGYWISQVVGGLLAGVALVVIAKGKPGFSPVGHMAANGYGEHWPGPYSLGAVIIAEVLLTAFFLIVVLGATDDGGPKGSGRWLSAVVDAHPPGLDPVISDTLGQSGSVHRRRLLQWGRCTRPTVGFWLARLIGGLIGGLPTRLCSERGNWRPVDEAPPAN